MTFTLLARSSDERWFGVTTATRTLAVGAIVPVVAPGVGALATQAHTNRDYRWQGIAALARGLAPGEALAGLVNADEGSALRQVALLAGGGAPAVHTGRETSAWSGHLVGERHVAMGNLLTGAAVVSALDEHARSWAAPEGALGFAQQLVAALLAADARGGDRRGRQSAAVLVGAVVGPVTSPPVLAVDLRVDDDAEAPRSLARLVERAQADAS